MKKLMMVVVAACAALGAQAETPAGYVTDNLVAFWDGYENNGVGGGHADTLTEWKDLLNDRPFTFNSKAAIEVGPLGLYFPGDTASYATLSADDTDSTFEQCANGVLEVVVKGDEADTTRVLVHSTTAAGIEFGNFGKAGGNARVLAGMAQSNGSPMYYFDWSKAISSISIPFAGSAGTALYTDACQVTSPGKTNGYTSGKDITYLGVRINNNTVQNAFKGTVYAIRLYSAPLTQAQREQNAVIDNMRFVKGDIHPMTGVYVRGEPQNYGTAESLGYGFAAKTLGAAVELTAPEYVEISATERAYCTGWKLYDRATGIQIDESTDETRLTCAFSYEKPVRVDWQWDVRYPVTASSAEEGLTVTPASAWGSAAAPAEFTVSGADFPLWSDGGLGGDVHAKTVAFAPAAATAVSVAKAVVREPTDFARLAAEIASAAAGDVIIVPNGTHSLAAVTAEQMAADYAVTVNDVLVTSRSGDPKDVVFDLGGTGHGFTLNAAGARLKGVTFTSSADMNDSADLTLPRFVNVIAGTLDGCAFTNIVIAGSNSKGSHAVSLAACGVIENCRFENFLSKFQYASRGVILAAGGLIRKTVFRSCNVRYAPVNVSGTSQVVVEDCSFTGINSNNLGQQATSAAFYGGPFVVRRTLIANNKLAGSNAAGYAGVAYISSLSRFEDCIITNNVSASDYGCFNGNVTCDRCIIEGNTGAKMGVAAGGQTPSTFRNCLIRGNVGGTAGVSSGGTQAKAFKFENCTVTGNKTKTGTGPALSLGSCGGTYAGWVKNCIVYGNGSQATDAQMVIDADKAFTSCYPEATADNENGNISADPQLNADGTLKYTSPCLDVGDNLALTAGKVDFVGTVRPQLSTDATLPLWDMGCYEMPPNEEPLVVTLTIDQTFGVSPASVTAAADVKGTKMTGLAFDWLIIRTTPNGVTTNTVPAQTESTYTFTGLEPGTYSVSVTVKNNSGDSAQADCADTFFSGAPVCYVARGGSATWPYDKPEKATLILGDAIGCAGERVEIAADEYSAAELGTMTDPVLGDTFLAVVSTPIEVVGAGPEETKFILDGTVAAFCVANEGAVVGGFTVSGAGRTDASFSGSSVRVAPGVVSNVVVRDGAVWGSALHVGYGGLFTCGVVTNMTRYSTKTPCVPVTLSSGTIADTLIAGNTGLGCGAVHADSSYLSKSAHIRRTKIVGNTALDGTSALLSAAPVAAVDSEFSGNTGGAVIVGGSVSLANCRVTNNTLTGGSAVLDFSAWTYLYATNVLVAANTGRRAVYCHNSCTFSIVNCTLTDNVAANAVNAGIYIEKNTVTVMKRLINNIFWNNRGTAGEGSSNAVIDGGTTVPTVMCCCWPEATDGNTDGDPKFRTPRRYRYYPSSTGSCYGTGDATFWTDDDFDLAGKPRKRDGAVDIGCYSIPPQPGLLLMLK